MKANELRLGNYVGFWGTTDFVTQVNEIEIETNAYNNVSINDVKPIPLTEEWLIKFGFFPSKYKDGYTISPYGKNEFLLDKEYTDEGEWDFCTDENYLKTIKYVHQLQNLYFALTNEELTTELG